MRLDEIFQVDWNTFMDGAGFFLAGRNPYEVFPPYPPTALTWMSLFVPLGAWGFWIFNALQLGVWWSLIKNRDRSQLVLLAWAPLAVHLLLGQVTLAIVLALWWVYRSPRRGLACGLAVAFAMTKPQVALIPVLYLLWHERASSHRAGLWGGMMLGTLLLGAIAAWREPLVWNWWLGSFAGFKGGLLHMAAWQGWGIIPLALAAWGWARRHPNARRAGWPWWIAAGCFQQGSFYAVAALLPVLRPAHNRWTLLGLGLAAVLQGPMSPATLPVILALHMVAAWLVAGGPAPANPRALSQRREGEDDLAAMVA